MGQAEIERVDPDLSRGREFIEQASRMLRDGDDPDISLAGSVVLYYQACLCAMDAVLAAAGSRVTSGINSHRVRIHEVAALLGDGYGDLADRMDEWRRERSGVSYAAVEPSAASVAALQQDAREMVEAAARFVNSRAG